MNATVHRYRARVHAMPAHTPTGWGWFYEIHDTAQPDGHRCVLSGARWMWSEALGASCEDLRRRHQEGTCP